MDADFHVAAVKHLVGQCVVEILGIIRINREHRAFAIVEPVGEIGRLDGAGNGRGFTLNIGGEFGGQVVLEENAEELGARLMGPAEAGGKGAAERILAAFPVAELDHDLVAFLGHGRETALGRIADRYLVAEARIIGLDDIIAPAAAQIAHDGVALALEHADDAADFLAWAATLAAGEDAGEDAVAGKGDTGVLGENLQRRGIAAIRNVIADHKCRSAGAELDATGELVVAQLGRGRLVGGVVDRLGCVRRALGLGLVGRPVIVRGRLGRLFGIAGRKRQGGVRRRHGRTAFGWGEDWSGGDPGIRALAGSAARSDAAVLGADKVPAFQHQAHLVGELSALFFIQTEAAGEFEFVGGRVICLAQEGEEAFAKSHG